MNFSNGNLIIVLLVILILYFIHILFNYYYKNDFKEGFSFKFKKLLQGIRDTPHSGSSEFTGMDQYYLGLNSYLYDSDLEGIDHDGNIDYDTPNPNSPPESHPYIIGAWSSILHQNYVTVDRFGQLTAHLLGEYTKDPSSYCSDPQNGCKLEKARHQLDSVSEYARKLSEVKYRKIPFQYGTCPDEFKVQTGILYPDVDSDVVDCNREQAIEIFNAKSKKHKYIGFHIENNNKMSLIKSTANKRVDDSYENYYSYIRNGGLQFTISYWIKINVDGIKEDKNIIKVLPKDQEDDHYFPYIYVEQGTTLIHFKITTGWPGETPILFDSTIRAGTISNQKWHHVAHVLYGRNIRHYIDGKFENYDDLRYPVFTEKLPNNLVDLIVAPQNINLTEIAQLKVLSLAAPLETILQHTLKFPYPASHEINPNGNTHLLNYTNYCQQDSMGADGHLHGHPLFCKASRQLQRPENTMAAGLVMSGARRHYYYDDNEEKSSLGTQTLNENCQKEEFANFTNYIHKSDKFIENFANCKATDGIVSSQAGGDYFSYRNLDLNNSGNGTFPPKNDPGGIYNHRYTGGIHFEKIKAAVDSGYRQPIVVIIPSGRVYLSGSAYINHDPPGNSGTRNFNYIYNPDNDDDSLNINTGKIDIKIARPYEGTLLLAHLPQDKNGLKFRPDQQLTFHVGQKQGYKVTIYPDGRIMVNRRITEQYFHFDGISYLPTFHSINDDSTKALNDLGYKMDRKCRYIRIRNGSESEFLNFSNIEIYPRGEALTRTEGLDNENIALGKTCIQSSVFQNDYDKYGPQNVVTKFEHKNQYKGGTQKCGGLSPHSPEKYIDKKWESPIGSFMKTGSDGKQQAWWEIDLVNEYKIRQVVIYNRLNRGDHDDEANNLHNYLPPLEGKTDIYYPHMKSLEGGSIELKDRYGKIIYTEEIKTNGGPFPYCNDSTKVEKTIGGQDCKRWDDTSLIKPDEKSQAEYKQNRKDLIDNTNTVKEQLALGKENLQKTKEANEWNARKKKDEEDHNNRERGRAEREKENPDFKREPFPQWEPKVIESTWAGRSITSLRGSISEKNYQTWDGGNSYQQSHANVKVNPLNSATAGDPKFFNTYVEYYDGEFGPESLPSESPASLQKNFENIIWAHNKPNPLHPEIPDGGYKQNYARYIPFENPRNHAGNNLDPKTHLIQHSNGGKGTKQRIWCYWEKGQHVLGNNNNEAKPKMALGAGQEYGEEVHDIKKGYWNRIYTIDFGADTQNVDPQPTGWQDLEPKRATSLFDHNKLRVAHVQKINNSVYLSGYVQFRDPASDYNKDKDIYKNEVEIKTPRNDNSQVKSVLSKEAEGTKFPINSIIAKLPDGYWPSHTISCNVTNQTDFARIEVTHKGQIKIKAASALLWEQNTKPWGDPDGTLAESLGGPGKSGPCTPEYPHHPQASGRTMNMVSLDGVRFPLRRSPGEQKLISLDSSKWEALGDYLGEDKMNNPNLMDGSIFTLANYKAKPTAGLMGMYFGNLRKFRIRGSLTIAFYIQVLKDTDQLMTILHKDEYNEGVVYYKNGIIEYRCGKCLEISKCNKTYYVKSDKPIKQENGRRFVTIVRNIEDLSLNIYIDGTRVGTADGDKLYSVSQGELSIGAAQGVGGALEGIKITNLNIFNRALDDDDRQALMKSFGLIGRNYGTPKVSKIIDERPKTITQHQRFTIDMARVNGDSFNPIDNYKRVNIVKLSGIFKWVGKEPVDRPEKGSDICRLPEEYRPNATLTFTVNGGDKGILIRIFDSGIIKYIGYEMDVKIFEDDILSDENFTKVISLDGIEFLTTKYN